MDSTSIEVPRAPREDHGEAEGVLVSPLDLANDLMIKNNTCMDLGRQAFTFFQARLSPVYLRRISLVFFKHASFAGVEYPDTSHAMPILEVFCGSQCTCVVDVARIRSLQCSLSAGCTGFSQLVRARKKSCVSVVSPLTTIPRHRFA